MSWDQYIDTILGNEGVLEAVICGKEGAYWDTRHMIKDITPAQIKKVTEVKGTGSTITVGGYKAMILKNDDDPAGIRLITLVTMKNELISETSPLVISISKQVVIIARGQPGFRSVGVAVENTATYLNTRGY